MKTINYFLIILFLSFFSSFSAQKNHVNYDRDTKWNFGLNAGGTWQEKELNFINKPGFSGGLTLGRAIYEKEGRLLSFDLRGRLLGGQTTGWSSVASYDSTLFSDHTGGYGFKNYKFEYVEGSLELVVNAHRLRERTGILLYAFGGVGLVSHSVKHNYMDGGDLYDYTAIDTTASKIDIANALKQSFNDYSWDKGNEFFDGTQTLFMPSLGLGLGYQITPKLSVGVEHKVTFGLNDNLDGHLEGKNDRYHYTNFNIRWNLFRGNDNGGSSYIPEERPIPNPNIPTGNNNSSSNGDVGDYSTPSTESSLGNKPLVNITIPASNGGKVYTANYNIKAKVYYVDGKNDILFKHNGIVVNNFTYNTSTNILNANVVLLPGANTFAITGTNLEGSDTDSKTINLDKICKNPTITFTKPINNGLVISTATTTIRATILNIANRNMIKFKHNGNNLNNFSFNTTTHVFSAIVNCTSGNNIFEIEAKNECASKTDTRTIVFNKPIVNAPPPVVTITSPSNSPYTTTTNQFNIGATVLNINTASQIQFKLNGTIVYGFNYNVATKVFNTTINLQLGNNVVEIKATNSYGMDEKTTIIIKKQTEQILPPVVTITYPSVSPFTTISNSSIVNGTVYNVSSANQIQVFINGTSTNNFTYDLNTKKISLNTSLILGSNLVAIKATNSSGVDTKSTTIIYKKQVVINPPVVSYIYPNTSPATVTSNNITINAKVLNVNTANQIQVTHNGTVIPIFNFNPTTKKVTINRNLILGSNIFNVKGTNQAGVDQKQTIIVYKKQVVVLPPVVTITSPNSNPFNTSNTSEVITARVDNISSQSQVSLNYNGLNINNFSYNAGSKTVTFTANLLVGANTLTIRANNSAGSDSKTQNITRRLPCISPVLGLQIPIQSPHNHVGRSGNMAFTFSSANLTSKNQITVKGNGYNIPFNLEQANGNIWGTIPLQVGANTLKVTVRNNCGQTSKEIQILYKGNNTKLVPPVITIQTPTSFPHTTTSSNVTVLGKVDNVSSQNNIQVTIDGTTSPFSFNTATKALVIPTALTIGSHQVRIRANNSYGNDMEVFDLIRTGPQIKAPIIQYSNLGTSNSYRNPYISSQRSYTVQGRVINNRNATITIYVNGTRMSNYSYNANTGAFSIPVSFSLQGQGTQRRTEVEVRASNSAGQATKKGHLVYLIQNISTKPNGSGNTNTSTLYNQHIKKANGYYSQRKLELAKSYYEKAAKANPKASFPKQRLQEIAKKLKVIKTEESKQTSPKIIKPSSTPKPIAKPSTEKKEINSWSTKPILKP